MNSLEAARSGWKWLEVAGSCWKLLEAAGSVGVSAFATKVNYSLFLTIFYNRYIDTSSIAS